MTRFSHSSRGTEGDRTEHRLAFAAEAEPFVVPTRFKNRRRCAPPTKRVEADTAPRLRPTPRGRKREELAPLVGGAAQLATVRLLLGSNREVSHETSPYTIWATVHLLGLCKLLCSDEHQERVCQTENR